MDIEKVKDKAAKLKTHMESAHAIGSTAEAEAFAGALNRLLIEYELSEDEIAYAKKVDEPIVEFMVDERHHGLSHKRRRVGWREVLATVVGEANMCQHLICRGTSTIWFCGTRQHAEVAGYIYAVLARSAEAICEDEYRRFYHRMRHTCERCGGPSRESDLCRASGHEFKPSFSKTHDYRESWLTGFILRIRTRLREERSAFEQTALVRLDNALARVQDHLRDKKGIGPVKNALGRENRAAYDQGTAAADRMPIRANAVRENPPKKIAESC